MTTSFLPTLIAGGMLTLTCLGSPTARGAQAPDSLGAGGDRVVHHFDFDERDDGNLEDVPMFWESFRPPGFPKFAQGRFDFEVGHGDSVSFYLSSEGRSVAYQYTGPDTAVQPNTSYFIQGYIRPDNLDYARACLSAHFLDHDGQPIDDIVVRSRLVGGASEEQDWHRVEMYLPPAPSDAHTIGLLAWVLHEVHWNTAERTYRYIPFTDVRGGAWFDDITIQAPPRLDLATSSPGNVLSPGEPHEIRVVLADYLDASLHGTLTIEAADGETVARHAVPVRLARTVEPQTFRVDDLDPGLYLATLHVYSGAHPIVTRSLWFAVLAPFRSASETLARPFGVFVDPRQRTDPDVEFELIDRLRVRSAKVPAWTGLTEELPATQRSGDVDRLLRRLTQNDVSLTGVFVGPPAPIIRKAGAYPRPLPEILTEDPSGWRDHLAAFLAPYASYFHCWQLGADDDSSVIEDDRTNGALRALRAEMLPYVPLPRLTAIAAADLIPADDKLEADRLSLTLGNELRPSCFAEQIDLYRALGYDRLAACIEPLPRREFERLPRLADWARRVILARHAGADTVYVPQPWQVRYTAQGNVVEPQEEYLILRTIADSIGDRTPGGRLRIAPEVEAVAFHGGATSVVVLWDAAAPPEGRRYAVQLGTATEQIDMWGRSMPLEHDERGRQLVTLTSAPAFVPNVERWLVELRQSVTLSPTRVDFGAESHAYAVSLRHSGPRPIALAARLMAPRSWELVPRTFELNLMPESAQEVGLYLRFPHTEPAGEKRITAQITISREEYYLEVPLAFELGLSDVEVWGLPLIRGENLILRHVVTNRSDETLHFRSSAVVPGRERQYQPLTNLAPGDTVSTEYRFNDAAELAGRKVRLILRELNLGSRIHNLELVVP
jgi:hypothetical protein